MRTTVTIDDDVMRDVKEVAHRKGLPFKSLVNQLLRMGLKQVHQPQRRKQFRQRTFSMGTPRPEFGSLDKALQLAGDLEDLEVARKLQLRK
jgi:hypothetical protein